MNIKNILILIFNILCNFSFSQVNPNHVIVSGYFRSDGTYVNPHYRTAPNSTNHDNFSTIGNSNPYTGKKGTIHRDKIFNSFPSSNQTLPAYTNQNTQYNPGKFIPLREFKDYNFRMDSKVFKLIKKSLLIDRKYNRSQIKESRLNRRKYKRLPLTNIQDLNDGWYLIALDKKQVINSKIENLMLKRYLKIENGFATKYIGTENMIFDVKTCYGAKGRYGLTIIYPDNIVSEVINIDFLSEKTLVKAPNFDYPSVVFFYTQKDNNGGKINLVVENKKRVYLVDKIENYWTEKPLFNNENINKVYLPKGKYLFYALNYKSLWTNYLTIDKECLGLELLEN